MEPTPIITSWPTCRLTGSDAASAAQEWDAGACVGVGVEVWVLGAALLVVLVAAVLLSRAVRVAVAVAGGPVVVEDVGPGMVGDPVRVVGVVGGPALDWSRTPGTEQDSGSARAVTPARARATR